MIRLAIIGTNWITEKFIDAALKTKFYQLSAVYSRQRVTAEEFAKKHAITKIFTDINALATSSDIDAVYIASPNALHFEQAKLMLQNGKDVICEKPLTSNMIQTQALIDIAKRHNQIIFEALKTCYLPNLAQIKAYLPKLGKIHKVFLNYCQYSSRYQSYLDGNNPNTFNPVFSNGSLMDIGVYPLNVAVALWGKPLKVMADAYLLASGVDAHGTILLHYQDFDVVVWHSKVSDSYLPSEIQGEQGALLIEHLSVGEKVSFKPRRGDFQDITLSQEANSLYYEAEIFAQLVQQRNVLHKGLDHSLMVAELLTEIRKMTGVIYPADKLGKEGSY